MYFSGRFIIDLDAFAATKGIRRNTLLAVSGYDRSELEEDGFLVDYNTVIRVFKELEDSLGLSDFGLLMGEQISLQATQFVDQLMESCPNVQEAFEIAVHYSKLISDAMLCSLEVEENSFQVNFGLNPDWAVSHDYGIIQNLDLALICTKNALNRLTEKEYYPTSVNLFYPKPKKLSTHFRLFNCHLNFNQPVSSIVFSKHLLFEKSNTNRLGLMGMLQTEANKLSAQLPETNPLLLGVKSAILKNIRPENCHVETIAGDLNLSVRSLQRQLKMESTSFKTIHNELRLKLAIKLMTQGNHNLDELAYLVGYSEASALIRAFKKWTGKSPKKYMTDQG